MVFLKIISFFSNSSFPGVEFKTKNININEDRLHLEIWDTSGQERFSIVAQAFYSKAQGIALCYSVDSKESFKRVEHWMEQVNSKARTDVCKILIGTKIDLPGRVISYEEGKALADKYGIKYIETSAKEKINVEKAFELLAKDIHDKELHIDKPIPALEGSQRLNSKRQVEQESSCCG